MAEVWGHWRATYTPGPWFLLSGPTSLLVLPPTVVDQAGAAEPTDLVETLWQQVLGSATIVDLASKVAELGIDKIDSFGAFFWSPEGMRSLVRGAISVIDESSGAVVANGVGMRTWKEEGLEGIERIRIVVDPHADQPSLSLPLVVGVATVSSVVLDASTAASVISAQGWEGFVADEVGQAEFVSTEDAQTDSMENADTELMEVPLLPTDEEETPAESLIPASLCPDGHLNAPAAGQCRICAALIAPQSPSLVPPPVLAQLTTSDGSTLALDRSVLIGRAPADSSDEGSHLLTVKSPNQDISRTHIRVSPYDWEILVTDLNSTNGTVLVRPGGGDRQRLTPGQGFAVPLNSTLELGDGVSVLIEHPR